MSTKGEISGSKGYLEERERQFEPRELDYIFDCLMRSAADWKEMTTPEQFRVWELLKKVDGMRQGSFTPGFRNGDHPKLCATMRA